MLYTVSDLDFSDKRHKLRKSDKRFGTWIVKRLYMASSLMTAAEVLKYKLARSV